MIRPRRYFPWKVASQLYFSHLAFVVGVLIVAGFSIRYQVYRTFLGATDSTMALAEFDGYLTKFFFWIFAASALYLIYTAWQHSKPLGRLIQRARELRRYDPQFEEGQVQPDDYNEEPGEWVDLERALTRISRDLRSKSEAHSREREELSALIGALSDAILAVNSK